MENENETKQCPYCGKEIHIKSKKCRFCDNWLEEEKKETDVTEEIECPFCAEKIKSSAKKCRFCGEWLDTNEEKQQTDSNKKSISNRKINTNNNLEKKNKKNIIILTSIFGFLLILLLIFVLTLYLYVPSCNSKTISDKLYKYLLAKNPEIINLVLDKKSAAIISKTDRGYSCSIDATVEDIPIHFEYDYQKISFNSFNFSAKPVLPDCYSPMVKTLLKDLIMDSNVYNIKEIASDVYTENETIDIFDKGKPCYKCKAQTKITSKPGTAFSLNYWDADAEREIKCDIDYKTYFCSNGFTTCVSLNNIYGCKYEKGE